MDLWEPMNCNVIFVAASDKVIPALSCGMRVKGGAMLPSYETKGESVWKWGQQSKWQAKAEVRITSRKSSLPLSYCTCGLLPTGCRNATFFSLQAIKSWVLLPAIRASQLLLFPPVSWGPWRTARSGPIFPLWGCPAAITLLFRRGAQWKLTLLSRNMGLSQRDTAFLHHRGWLGHGHMTHWKKFQQNSSQRNNRMKKLPRWGNLFPHS